MRREGEIVGVVSISHVKAIKTNPGVPYDSGEENCWSPSSSDECDKEYN